MFPRNPKRRRGDQSRPVVPRIARAPTPAIVKVLLDEDLPQPLARVLPQHDIRTVAGMGWTSIKNGKLLALIEEERFAVFVTSDKNMSSQQPLAGRPFAVLVFSAISWPLIKRHLPAITIALDQARPGTVLPVTAGRSHGSGHHVLWSDHERLQGCLIHMASAFP